MRPGGAVWLVGMMGAGKSAVGAALAGRLGLPFADVDHLVERSAGRSVSEIFASEGEAGFRRREREAVEGLEGQVGVFALGGGAIAQPGMAAWLAARGTVVYLKAEAGTLLDRMGDASERPLLGGLTAVERRRRLEDLLAARRPAYESARVVVSTDGRSVEEVAKAVLAALEEAS
jgi:shikimate kinase